LLALLLVLTAIPARAEEPRPAVIVVVPLDGAPGTSSRDLEVVARGLAEAMAAEPDLLVVSGPALVGRITALKQRALQEARDATSEGALLLVEGSPDLGIAFLEEAVAAHDRAGSAVVRRDEMADAAFALAKAWLQTGRDDEAAGVLTLALRLSPDYLDIHPDQVDPRLRALARRVEATLAERPPRRLSSDGGKGASFATI
jgi:tetratricopeptide (TPR) repeat protein